MNLSADNRTLITARQAAELLGLSMVRVRQLCRSGRLWSLNVSNRMRMLDAAEVRRFAEDRENARISGTLPGPPPGGFAPG